MVELNSLEDKNRKADRGSLITLFINRSLSLILKVHQDEKTDHHKQLGTKEMSFGQNMDSSDIYKSL